MTQTKTATDFVYLVRDGSTCKIGMSIAPERRLLEVASPAAVIVHLIPSANPRQVEAALHRRFADCRADGPGREWFRLDEASVEAICRLPQTDAADDLPPDLRPATPGSRHQPKRVARISDQDFDDLNQLAAQHDRPWTWELKRAIRAHLQAHGIVHGEHHAESE